MDKEINKVYSSSNYSQFSFIETNRELRLAHVEELKESMREHPLEKPIDVNEKFQIIDGQHRYMAWQDLGMPIIYMVHKGWGAKEVPILNTNQKNWNPSDFVKMYSESGNQHYQQYKEFAERYGFTHVANTYLLSGGRESETRTRNFNEGRFEVRKWTWANIMAKQIIEIRPYYGGYKRSSFVVAYCQLASDKVFRPDILMDKIKMQQRRMVDCSTRSEYYEMLLEIYNYKTRSENRLVEKVEID